MVQTAIIQLLPARELDPTMDPADRLYTQALLSFRGKGV
jgi:hypothetical protein